MNILKKADDKQELRKLLDNQEEREELPNLPADTMNVIKEFAGIDIEVNEEGGTDMCKGLEGLLEDARLEGISEGIEEGERSGIIKTYFIMYNKGRISKEDVLEELQITEEELDEIINNNYK